GVHDLPVERHYMNFTPKVFVRPVTSVLAIAVVGLIVWVGQFVPARAQFAATQDSFIAQGYPQTSGDLQIAPAVYWGQEPGFQTYQPVSSWYKNKHWWKRNAPIVGGAAGGALIGGLAGGGTGALVGGAVGGGGGALYKHYHHRHYHHNQYRK